MSDPMIASGDARVALAAPVRRMGVGASGTDSEGLVLAPGLGFLPGILADQHFGERGRLGRLLVALAERPRTQRLGLGVDEDTAVIIDLARRRATVAGKGRAWVVDARRGRLATPPLGATEVRLSLATAGQAIDLRRMTILSPNGARR
jgi:cyanophycinase